MTKLYAEIIEKEVKNPKFFGVEVESIDEAKTKLLDEEKKSDWIDLQYQKRIHRCFHDEQINKPCEVSYL